MMRNVGAGVFAGSLLALAALLPPQAAAAQDAVGGAIVGGALGGILGGALGHGRGAVAGAIAGATAGAVIASEAQPRPGGYFWWRGGCYYRYPDGAWSQPLRPDYCGY
jgi:Glycine zipper 2TM domain